MRRGEGTDLGADTVPVSESPTIAPPKAAAAASPTASPRLTAGAMALLLVLCLICSGNLVAIKFSNLGFQPVFGSALRSGGAALVLGLYAVAARHTLRVPLRSLLYCFLVAFFFAAEFFFMFLGMQHTSASRGTILINTAPFWVAVGAHVMFKERLTRSRVLGLLLAFAGVVFVLADRTGLSEGRLLGDGLLVLASLFWAANTLYGKRSMVGLAVTPLQLLFYQVAFSFVMLLVASLLVEGTPRVVWRVDSMIALLEQAILVAAATYLAWFWLLGRFQAGQVAAFTFVTPLFGVIMGNLFLNEPLSWLIWLGVLLVAAGIYLVSRK